MATAVRDRQAAFWSLDRLKPTNFAYLLISPSMLIVALLAIIPAVIMIAVSFYNTELGDFEYMGWENYLYFFDDDMFWPSLSRSTIYTLSSVYGAFLISFSLASSLNQRLRFSAFFRGLILLSWCVPLTVAGLVWRWSLHSSLGWINDLLLSLHLVDAAVPFLSDPTLAMISIIICDIWTRVPFMTLILLAGLQNIPDELGEAATVDGANVFQRLRFITAPMMTPHIFVVLLFNTIFAFRTLAFSYGMTKGGPAQATYLYAQLIYERVFLDFRLGSAATLSIAMFLMTGGIVAFYATLYKLFAPKT